MATFVLVSGGHIYRDGKANLFGGAWNWREVEFLLREAGHQIFVPTLTGMGEKAHLVSPDINLNTHIQDVMGVIECEELQDVILVGWSFSGLTITGVAGKAADRLAHLVYLDALVPFDGERAVDLIPNRVADWEQNGMGAKTLHQPVFGFQAASSLSPTYIYCTDKPNLASVETYLALRKSADRAKDAGWRYREILATHGGSPLGPRRLKRVTGSSTYEKNPNALNDTVELLLEAATARTKS